MEIFQKILLDPFFPLKNAEKSTKKYDLRKKAGLL